MRPSPCSRVLLPTLLGVLTGACGGGGGGGGGGTASSAPSALSFGSPATAFLLGVPVDVRPSVQGAVSTWSVDPPLPAGLALDPASGAITGTPSATLPPTAFRVTGSNASGSTSAVLEITVAHTPRVAYVASAEDDGLAAYVLDVASGRLRFAQSAQLPATQTRPSDVVVHPELPFAFVLTRGNATAAPTIATFALDPLTGAPAYASSVPAPAEPIALELEPGGAFLYALGGQPSRVAGYAIDPSDGSLSALGAPVAAALNPTALALDPLGRFAWVASSGTGTVQAFEIDAGNGALAPFGTPLFLNSARPGDLAVDAKGRFLVASMTNFPFLLSIAIDRASGSLSVVASAAVGASGARVAAHPSGRFVHALRLQDDTLLAYRLDPATGKLTSSSAGVTTPGRPMTLGFDEAGLYAWVLAVDTRDVTTYRIALDSGAPTPSGTVRARGVPTGAAWFHGSAPYRRVPRLLFAANQDDGTISTYRVEADGAELVEIGPPVLTNADPVDLVVDPKGRFLFVVAGDVPEVETFTVDVASGTLTSSGQPAPLAGQPTSVLVEGGSRYLFVASRVTDEVAAFEIQPAGELALRAVKAVGTSPRRLALGATERFLYVASQGGGGSLRAFGIDAGTFQAGPPPIGTNGLPLGLAFAPGGARAFAPASSPEQVLTYDVDAVSGQLAQAVPAVPIAQPLADTVAHPGGAYVFAAFGPPQGAGFVSALRLNVGTGGLQPVAEAPVGIDPRRIVVAPDGRHAYVANHGGDDLSLLAFDLATGALVHLAQVPAGNGPVALALLSTVE